MFLLKVLQLEKYKKIWYKIYFREFMDEYIDNYVDVNYMNTVLKYWQ